MKLDDFTNEKVEKEILQELENIQKIMRLFHLVLLVYFLQKFIQNVKIQQEL